MKIQRVFVSVVFGIGFVVIMMMALTAVTQPASAHVNATQEIAILVDDFIPQPYPGNPVHYYNRMSGDRGALSQDPDTMKLDFGKG